MITTPPPAFLGSFLQKLFLKYSNALRLSYTILILFIFPNSPLSKRFLVSTTSGENRNWLTTLNKSPFLFAFSTRRFAFFRSTSIGFSTTTCFPASKTLIAISPCVSFSVTINTTLLSLSFKTSSKFLNHFISYFAANSLPLSSFRLCTPISVISLEFLKALTYLGAIAPAPTKQNPTLLILSSQSHKINEHTSVS